MTLFLFIFQCFCFMKNPGGVEINLNTEKKIKTFCFNTVTQLSFLCWHASNDILLASHFDNIAFPMLHQMLNCYISRPFIMSLPLHFSASPPLLCTITCAWEEISVGTCGGPLWMASTPSFPPLCPCPQGWCRLLGWWCSQYGPTVSVRSPICIHLLSSLLSRSGCARVPGTVVEDGRRAGVTWH